MDRKILRKLDFNENVSIDLNDLSNITKLFKIETDIDYYEHLNLFKEAIVKWNDLHPFLRAKIETIESSNYFVENENHDNLLNVQFLNVLESSMPKDKCKSLDEHFNDLLELFLERETYKKINHQEKLWRLTLVKLVPELPTKSLIDIFEAFYRKLNTYENIKPLSILPSMENLYFSDQNKFSTTSFVSSFKRPTFFVNLNTKYEPANKLANKYDRHLKSIVYSVNDRENHFSIKNLITDAQNNISKFKQINFEEKDLFKLIHKLKKENVKMQAFLNMIFSFGLKKLYEDRGNASETDHNVVFAYAVNLRKFSDDSSIFGSDLNENMGVSTNIFVSSLREEIDFSQDFATMFWSCVRLENNEILKRLETNEQFKIPHTFANSGQICFDMVLSNIGIMATSYSKESLHKVKSCYFTGVNEFTNKLGFSYFITVNNLLCWSFLFNSLVINDEIAETIIQNIKNFFHYLINT